MRDGGLAKECRSWRMMEGEATSNPLYEFQTFMNRYNFPPAMSETTQIGAPAIRTSKQHKPIESQIQHQIQFTETLDANNDS